MGSWSTSLSTSPPGAVRDEAALDIFRHQWELYRKFLKYDYLENAGAYAELHRFLDGRRRAPLRFRRSRLRGCERHRDGAQGHRRSSTIAASISRRRRWRWRKRNLEALPCAVEAR